MTIYDRLKKGINSRINKGLLDDFYVEKTKNQLDILKALQGEPQQVQQNVPSEQKPPQNARKGGKTNG